MPVELNELSRDSLLVWRNTTGNPDLARFDGYPFCVRYVADGQIFGKWLPPGSIELNAMFVVAGPEQCEPFEPADQEELRQAQYGDDRYLPSYLPAIVRRTDPPKPVLDVDPSASRSAQMLEAWEKGVPYTMRSRRRCPAWGFISAWRSLSGLK